MKKLMVLVMSLLLAFSLVAFAACGKDKDKGSATTDEPVESGPKTVTIGHYGDISLVSHFESNDIWLNSGASGLITALYDSCYYMDGNGDWATRIVEDATWTDDTHLAVKIRDGIYYSNGTQLTGKDILFSLGVSQGAPTKPDHFTVIDLDQSSVSDDGLTINLTFKQPYALYQKSLSSAIYSEEYITSKGGGEAIDWYDSSQLVGSGPYTIAEFVQDNYIVIEKRDDWWGFDAGLAVPFDSAKIVNYSDQTTMIIDLQNGVIDAAFDISLQDYNTLSVDDSDDITIQLVPGNAVQILAIDTKEEKFSDKNTRLALAHAVDIKALTEAVCGSLGTPATSTAAPVEIGYVDGLWYKYDPELAKSLLAEAGYTDANPLKFTFNTFSFEPYTSTAEILQSYWKEIGIDCTVNFMEMGAYFTGGGEETEVEIYGVAGGNATKDPTAHLASWVSSSMDKTMRRDKSYDDLINAGVATLDKEKRAKIYAELQQKFYDNVDCFPLYEQNLAIAFNSTKIESMNVGSIGYTDLLDMVLK
jgi:peptide/nickel transport system substrate-binding protein